MGSTGTDDEVMFERLAIDASERLSRLFAQRVSWGESA
jgi:hypothetical protein